MAQIAGEIAPVKLPLHDSQQKKSAWEAYQHSQFQEDTQRYFLLAEHLLV